MRILLVVVGLVVAACGSVTSTPLEITPGSVNVAPRGSQMFESSIATGITWSLSTNASGGTIDASTGRYTAGATPDVTDVVTLTLTGGTSTTASVTVGPGVSIGQADPHVHSGSRKLFTATGGSASGFDWTIENNQSTGTIDPTTGNYQAGPHSGVIDIVSVTDDLGNSAQITVTVRPLQIYIGDSGNARVVRVDDLGGANFVGFGTSGAGVGQFARPVNMFVADDERIYIADQFNHRVARMDDMAGTNFVSFGTAGTDVGQFGGPVAIAVDADGKIFIADFDGNRIVRMDDMAGTNFVAFGTVGAGVGQFNGPTGVALDSTGKIYVVEQNNSRIARMDDMAGTNFVSFGTAGTGLGQFSNPDGLFVADDRIYIADTGNNRIVRMNDIAGAGLVTFGTAGTAVGQFSTPTGVAVDGFGKIYVAEFSNNRIDKMDDMVGTNLVVFGTAGAGTNQFGSPYGLFAK